MVATQADREIFAARTAIFDLVAKSIGDEFTSVKRTRTTINAHRSIGETCRSFQVLDKYSYDCHRFEVYCGLNWHPVWRLVWADRPDIVEKNFRYMALVGLSAQSLLSIERLSYSKLEDVGPLAQRILSFYKDIAVPFYERWGDYRRVQNEFIDITPEVRKVCIFAHEISKIAASIALLDGNKDLAAEILARHGLYWTERYPSASIQEKLESFAGEMRRRGML